MLREYHAGVALALQSFSSRSHFVPRTILAKRLRNKSAASLGAVLGLEDLAQPRPPVLVEDHGRVVLDEGRGLRGREQRPPMLVGREQHDSEQPAHRSA